MWQRLFTSRDADSAFVASAQELLLATTRNLIWTTVVLAGAGVFLLAVKPPAQADQTTLPIVTAAIVVCWLAIRLSTRRLLAAQTLWLAALVGLALLAIHLLGDPLIGFLLAFLPLLAVIVLGWPAGVIGVGIVEGLAWALTTGRLASPLPVEHGLGIIAGAVIAGGLGWGATRSMFTITRWAVDGYRRAEAETEQARAQRMEFQQVQEDLLQANRELARLSDRLKAMYQVAEEARRAKEEFVANVSHELRTPLNMIIGFAEMITDSPHVYGGELPPALVADITAIQRNSQHLARLVDDVLDLSQVEAGKMVLTKEWTSLSELIAAAALAVRPLYESKGLYLHTEAPADLTAVFCDATRIRQVALNLLSNAGRFTQEGGVVVRTQRSGAEVVVSVTDTGPGIAPELQKKLFQPFQQLDGSLRRTHGGTGLGLTISKRFVEMHDGRMWLESPARLAGSLSGANQGGAGTTFHFALPLDTPALTLGGDAMRWFNPYQPYEARARESKAPAPHPATRYVLLERGDALCRRFREHADPAEIVTVHDIAGARRELERSPARALIVNAPALSELQVTAGELADLPYRTPAITCWTPAEDEATRRLGVVRYLVKPITRETLLSALESLGREVATVLLVDDEPDVVRLFSRIMASAERPYRVLRANDGQRALDLLRERRPDVLLLDLILPGMDGFQVLREKNDDPAVRDIPVIVISSRDPVGEPVASDSLTVTRSGGLSVRDLAACVEAISSVLTPAAPSGGQGLPGTPSG